MSVTPKDFLDSAILILRYGNSEIEQRNIISRAYYSAYHRACELIAPEKTDENIGMHKRYIIQLNKGVNGSIERKLGGKMKTMYARRHTADYKLLESIEKDAARMQVLAAEELFSVIDKAEINASAGVTKASSGGSMPAPDRSGPKLRVVK